MEDLFTFNEEIVVRAVAACAKPVVSAVGHETDVTLCDLAADLRAPTPSAAAECAVPLRAELCARIEALNAGLKDGMLAQIASKQNRLRLLATQLSERRPSNRLAQERKRLDALCAALDAQVMACINDRKMQLSQRVRELEMLSPYRVLSRGYAIVTRDGVPVVSSAQLQAGDRVRLRFADGEAAAAVIDSEEA